jgi:hypothetical protein
LDKSYFSEEDYHKEILNNKESEMLQDTQLQKIKQKYLNQKIKVFRDEANFSDQHFLHIWDEFKKREQEEINNYLQKKGENNESIK